MSLSTKLLPEGSAGLRSAQAPSAGLTPLAHRDFQVHLRHKKRRLVGPSTGQLWKLRFPGLIVEEQTLGKGLAPREGFLP